MRQNESYSAYISVSFILTLAILFSFQLYISREPGRIEADQSREQLIAITAGRSLYFENCAMCHGDQGEGVDAPPLNDKNFLLNTTNDRMFSLIGSGVPSSEMPAWNQVHGGPFTDQQVNQLVAFIREWEQNAPDRQALASIGDPVTGVAIYNSTCIVCHGGNGQGTEIAPRLNDPARLAQFDDEWYTNTISAGRLAQGMPTWGTVLSTTQIRDLVALLRAWERGETVDSPGPAEALNEALHMLEHGDFEGAEHALQTAAEGASGEVLALINEAIIAAENGDKAATEEIIHHIVDLLGKNLDEHEEGSEQDDH